MTSVQGISVRIPDMGAIKNIRHQQADRNYRSGDRELWIMQGQYLDVDKSLYNVLLSPLVWQWQNLVGAFINEG